MNYPIVLAIVKQVMEYSSKIYVAGHRGLVGSALMRALTKHGYHNLIVADLSDLDLRNQAAVNDFFATHRPDYVYMAAARVGGIRANSLFPVDFLYDNLMIAANTIHAAYTHRVRKFLFLGSSCIYPRECTQPIIEESLLSGPLEPTNQWYALAKIAGIKLCQAYQQQYPSQGTQFICAMPTNLYGIGDTYQSEQSHVIPALIMKLSDAYYAGQAAVTLWGSGRALRDFLYVDDLAEALILLMEHHTDANSINIGSGTDCSIAELAHTIADIIGFRGDILFDPTQPDGTPRKLLDTTRMDRYGWSPRTPLYEGLEKTITAYHAMKGLS